MSFKIISAGAGSGKTYRLTQEMVELLQKKVRPSGIIATTFTNKAAAELQERVRVKLLEEGMMEQANELTNALIGTVHSLGVKLLKRFAFEAGVSPDAAIMADEDRQLIFNNALSTVLTSERIKEMELLGDRLGLNKRGRVDWRSKVREITDLARGNDFSIQVLELSRQKSIEQLLAFLDQEDGRSEAFWDHELMNLLQGTIDAVDTEVDGTKLTKTALNELRSLIRNLELRGSLYWYEWAKLSKLKTGAKSREAFEPLLEFAGSHDAHPRFRKDIRLFITHLFDLAIAAISEYELYKKQRGLIDYIDMEIQIKQLLDHPHVQEILADELDLLMVDEFQDTNPIQLEIFLKLSKFAKFSVWVGDPKQSIYGFRGAEPRLMQAIIDENGGIPPEDIQRFSWRSRSGIVNVVNAIFSKAFPDLPEEQIALLPKRQSKAGSESSNKVDEPEGMTDALIHWHFKVDDDGRTPGSPWMENNIADSIQKFIEAGKIIFDKVAGVYRSVRPGDIAILCRSNSDCQKMAEAVHHAGMKAAIARTGLLNTAEVCLILACLKYILNEWDSLSAAEILLLAARIDIEEIIEDRLDYLEKNKDYDDGRWAADSDYLGQLNALRREVVELSGAEILNLVLETLDLRRVIARWGRSRQRLDNVDVLRKLALQYEENCNRLYTAASLGGFLLWLGELQARDQDAQGSGEGIDAVNVLTYHKSKGLEWPVVICHSLEGKLHDSVWGIGLEALSETIDINNILANRWIRYWVNPYADQSRRTKLETRMQESELQKRVTARALAEDARLLYVGLTRARDYLIFPTRNDPTRWLNRVWQDGDSDIPTLDSHSEESPWYWNDEVLLIETSVLFQPRSHPVVEPKEERIRYIEPFAGTQKHVPALIQPEELKVKKQFGLRNGGKIQYADEVNTLEGVTPYQIARLIKAVLHAERRNLSPDARLHLVDGLLERHQLGGVLDAGLILYTSKIFFEWLDASFSYDKIYRKYPLRLEQNERHFVTIADLVLVNKDEVVLLQHSSYAGSSKQCWNKAKKLGGWLYLSKKVLERIFQRKVRTIVHFVLLHTAMEVEVTAKAQQRLIEF